MTTTYLHWKGLHCGNAPLMPRFIGQASSGDYGQWLALILDNFNKQQTIFTLPCAAVLVLNIPRQATDGCASGSHCWHGVIDVDQKSFKHVCIFKSIIYFVNSSFSVIKNLKIFPYKEVFVRENETFMEESIVWNMYSHPPANDTLKNKKSILNLRT